MLKSSRRLHGKRKQTARFAIELLESRSLLAANDVLINEIMYHPGPTNTGGEYIELFNRGSEAVQLAGWRIMDAIDYTFQAGVSIDAGDYLVIFGDPQAVNFYGLTNGAGPFNRQLDNAGERIALHAANGALIDEVEYDDVAPWVTAADGSGPSLELIDPDSDNNTASSWAAGQLYTPGRANQPDVTGAGGDIVISELMYRPLMYQYVSPIDPIANQPHWRDGEDPDGEYVELFNRGTTTIDMSRWKLLDSGGVLYEFSEGTMLAAGEHLVVAGNASAIQQRYGIANVVGDFVAGRQLSDSGEPVTLLSATGRLVDVVHYSDSPPWPIASDQTGASLEVLDPMADNSTPANWRSTRAENPPLPARPAIGERYYVTAGTPGVANSVAAAGLPPFMSRDHIQHSPARPTSSDAIRVVATNVTSEDPLSSISLNYEVFVAPYQVASQTQAIAMRDDGQGGDETAGDGQYTAIIPPMASQSLLRYRISIADTAGRSWTYPDDTDPNPNKAVFSYDGEEETEMSAYFLIVPDATRVALERNIWTHEFHDATIVIDGIVHDHVGIHYRGRGWRVHPKKSYRVAFNKTELFQGMNRLDLAMHFPTMQNLVHNLFYSVGAPTMGSEPIRLYRNGNLYGLMLAQESPNSRWLEASGMDPDGEVFKASSAASYNQNGFTGDVMADLDYFDDPSVYPRIWEKKGDALGSYDSIIELTDIIANTPEDQIYQRFSETIELDSWLYAWAVHVAGGNGDIVGTNYSVVKPGVENAKWQYLTFDFSHFFGCQMLDFVDVICNPYDHDPYRYFNHFHFRVMNNEQLRNRFLVILKDVLENQMRPSRVNAMIEQTWATYQADRLDEVALNIPGPPQHYVVHEVDGVALQQDRKEMKEYYQNRHQWLLETWIPSQGITLPENTHPTIRLGLPNVSAAGASIVWTHQDAEGDPATVDLYWTDGKWNHYVPIEGAQGLNAADGSFLWANPPGRINTDIFIEAVIRDGVSDLVGRDTSVKAGPPDVPLFEVVNHDGQATLTLTNPNEDGLIFYTLNGSDPRGSQGEVANEAVAYAGPVVLTENTVVRARVRAADPTGDGFQWSDMVEDIAVVAFPSLAVTEIMYNPLGGTNYEYIELFNYGSRPVKLNHIVVGSRGVLFDLSQSPFDSLEPGEYLLLVKNQEAFAERYDTAGLKIAGVFDQPLSNTQQSINLTLLPLREPFVAFAYEDNWQPTTDGPGNSLVLINPHSLSETWSSSDAWRASITVNGSPGRADVYGPDINNDQVVDLQDIHLLCSRIEANDLRYDLSQDGLMDQRDLRYLIEDVLGTSIGDTNLDGRFDSQDLANILALGQYEDDIARNSSWETGDWNCDSEFNTKDLIDAMAAGGYDSILRNRVPAHLNGTDFQDIELFNDPDHGEKRL